MLLHSPRCTRHNRTMSFSRGLNDTRIFREPDRSRSGSFKSRVFRDPDPLGAPSLLASLCSSRRYRAGSVSQGSYDRFIWMKAHLLRCMSFSKMISPEKSTIRPVTGCSVSRGIWKWVRIAGCQFKSSIPPVTGFSVSRGIWTVVRIFVPLLRDCLLFPFASLCLASIHKQGDTTTLPSDCTCTVRTHPHNTNNAIFHTLFTDNANQLTSHLLSSFLLLMMNSSVFRRPFVPCPSPSL
jgi:hypothetical protein